MTYVGLGDLRSGALHYYGLRGYSAAVSNGTTKAIKVRRASDNATLDVVVLSSGDIDTASLATFLTSTTGFVTTWYDQIGGADVAQATTSKQPQILLNDVNGRPSVKFVAASLQVLTTTVGAAVTSPSTQMLVGVRTTTSGGWGIPFCIGTTGPEIEYNTTAGNWSAQGSGRSTGVAFDQVWHSCQVVYNGASSKFYIDALDVGTSNSSLGSPTLGSPTGVTLGNQPGGSFPTEGKVNECAFWNAALSAAEIDSIYANIHDYWYVTPAQASTWNTIADRTTNVTFSNGNKTISATSTSSDGAKGTNYKLLSAGGKFYVEFTGQAAGYLGIASDKYRFWDASKAELIVLDAVGNALVNTGSGVTATAAPSGHTIGMAIDLVNKKVWFRLDNGNWNNDILANQNPATNTGGFSFSSWSPTRITLVGLNINNSLTMIPSGFSFTKPSGFLGWDDAANNWASTEAADTFGATGYPGFFGPTGFLNALEATDGFSAAGYPATVGTLSARETTDIFSAFLTLPVKGTFTVTEATDRFSAAGLGRGEDGVFITTEAPDQFAATGTVPIAGVWASTETPDQFRAFSSGTAISSARRVFFVT